MKIRNDSGDYGCCSTCTFRDSAVCASCEDADQYEIDLDKVEEQLEEEGACA